MTVTSVSGTLSIISDTICPWCFVGKRRLDAVLPILAAEGLTFNVEWKPYQLNPDMPETGMDRRTYRTAKAGSLIKSVAMDARMTALGADEGIDFRYDLIARTPNTLASHVMIADARRAGGLPMQTLAVERLFEAYFTHGRDVGRAEVLRAISMEAGFDHAQSSDAELWEFVRKEDRLIRASRRNGVPTVLLDGHYLFSGAQPRDTMLDIIKNGILATAALRREISE